MFLQVLKRSALAALALAVLAPPVPAAPVIKSGGPSLKLDKYLLDDVNGVLVIDIKQIMASPAYKKNFHKQLAEDLPGSGAKCVTHGKLASAACGPDQQKAGDIHDRHRDDQQHHSHDDGERHRDVLTHG